MTAPEHPPDGGRATDEIERALGVWNRFLFRTDNTLHQKVVKYVSGEDADKLQAAYNVIAERLRAADGGRPSEPTEEARGGLLGDIEDAAVEILLANERSFALGADEVQRRSYNYARVVQDRVKALRAVDFGRGRVAAESGNE
jgi:hypothetical protein